MIKTTQRSMVPAAALVAAAFFFGLLAPRPVLAQAGVRSASKPVAGDKPAAPAPARSKPGDVLRTVVPGGWLLQVDGHSDYTTVQAPAFSPRTHRSLLVVTATSRDFAKLEVSQATILDGGGKPVRLQPLGDYRPLTAALSPDGTMAAVGAQPYHDTAGAGVLLFFDQTGQRMWRKPFVPGQEILFGAKWIALWSPPYVTTALDGDPEEMPPGRVANPVVFHRLDGSPMKPVEPIVGGIALAGDGLAAVSSGRLTLYKPNLAKRGTASLGFDTGLPYAAADGSLIAVADFSEGEDKPTRALALFDADAKKTGEVRLPAAYGLSAAVAPDGAAVLVTPATIGPDGPLTGMDTGGVVELALADRTGKVLWRHKAKTRTPTEHFSHLSVAVGGKRAAAGLRTGDPDQPDRLIVFDASGKVLYETEGEFQGLWLDPLGDWLYTVEEGGLSRLKIKDLVSGTAFPEDFGEADEIHPDDLRELADPDPDADEAEVWNDDEAPSRAPRP